MIEYLDASLSQAHEVSILFAAWAAAVSVAWIYVAVIDWRTHEAPWSISWVLLLLAAGTVFVSSDSAWISRILSTTLGGGLGLVAYLCVLGLGIEVVNNRVIGRGDRELLIAAGATCGITEFAPILLPTMTTYIIIYYLASLIAHKIKHTDIPAGLPLAPGITATVLIYLTGLPAYFFA